MKPRAALRQKHRPNAEELGQSTSEYCRLNIYYSFIGHVQRQLSDRFTTEHDHLIAVETLLPGNIQNLKDSHILSINKFY